MRVANVPKQIGDARTGKTFYIDETHIDSLSGKRMVLQAILRVKDCSLIPQSMTCSVNPEGVTTDWRAVCGRPACTVRREGRRKPFYPYQD